MSYVVYCHTAPNGKKYIGATSMRPERRWRGGEGYKRCRAFYDAIQEFGWGQFKHDILLSGLSRAEAHAKESEYIEKYNTLSPNGYNLETGGTRDKSVCQEAKERQSASHKNPSDDTRRKISEALKGRALSHETKEKIGNASRGRSLSAEAREKIRRSREGMHYSHAVVAAMSIRFSGEGNPMYGRHHSEETKERIAATKRGASNPASKKVKCLDDGLIFDSMSEASTYYGIDARRIGDCCRGVRKRTKGRSFSHA